MIDAKLEDPIAGGASLARLIKPVSDDRSKRERRQDDTASDAFIEVRQVGNHRYPFLRIVKLQ